MEASFQSAPGFLTESTIIQNNGYASSPTSQGEASSLLMILHIHSVSAANTYELGPNHLMSTRRLSHSATTDILRFMSKKTKLIIFRPISKKLPDNFEILFDNVPLNLSSTVIKPTGCHLV